MARINPLLFILIIFASLWYPQYFIEEGIAETEIVPETVKIGVLLPLSGSFSDLARSILNAITAAAYQLNNSNELGFNITLLVEDTQDLDSQAIQAYSILKSQDIHLILGPMFSGPTELVAKQATEDQIVQICFSATSSALSSSQYSYFFRTIPPDNLQTQALESLILNFDLNSVFIINHNDVWANSLVSDFYNRNTLVIQNQSYANFESDSSLLMSKIKQVEQNFDAILLIALVDDVKLILPRLKQAGINNPLFGTEATVAGDLMDDPNSTIYPEVFSGTVPHIFTQREFGYDNFSNALLDCSTVGICLENNSGSNYDAYAYDALWIGAKAIQIADSYQGFDIKANMDKAANSYIGATGNKSFTENGDPFFSLFDIYQYQRTQYTKVGTWNTISGLSLNENVVSITAQPIQIVRITTIRSTVTMVELRTKFWLFDIPTMLDSFINSILVASLVFLLVIVLYVNRKRKIVEELPKKEKNAHFNWFQKYHKAEKQSLSDETFNMLEEIIEETKEE